MIKQVVIVLLILHCGKSYSQSYSSTGNNLIGRFSTGWSYYSQGASLTPQLSAISSYGMLNYRVFDAEKQNIRYQWRIDFYEKDALASTQTLDRSAQFDHRFVIRQLYGSYSAAGGEIKAGRLIPLSTNLDAFPINGFAAENLLFAKHYRVSAFGGKIFDEYDNRIEGLGYNAGASVAYEDKQYMLGTGFSSEQLRLTKLSKAYLFGEYRPKEQWRLSSKNQYSLTQSLLGYSQNSMYYRFSKILSARTYVEYHDRRAYAPSPTDSLGWDRYFQTSKEMIFGGSIRYQVFQLNRIGQMDLLPAFKKRVGNDGLTYGSLQINYRNFFYYRFNTGLGMSYMSNQWLNNFKVNTFWNKDYLKGQLDVTAALTINSYTWNTQTASSNKLTSIFSTDVNYRPTSSWNIAGGLFEEFGNATDAHLGFNLRISYSFR